MEPGSGQPKAARHQTDLYRVPGVPPVSLDEPGVTVHSPYSHDAIKQRVDQGIGYIKWIQHLTYIQALQHSCQWFLETMRAGIAKAAQAGAPSSDNPILVSKEGFSAKMVARDRSVSWEPTAKDKTYILFWLQNIREVVVLTIHGTFTVELPCNLEGLKHIYLRLEFAAMRLILDRLDRHGAQGVDQEGKSLIIQLQRLEAQTREMHCKRQSGWLTRELGVREDAVAVIAYGLFGDVVTQPGSNRIGALERVMEAMRRECTIVQSSDLVDPAAYAGLGVSGFRRLGDPKDDYQKSVGVAFKIGMRLLWLAEAGDGVAFL